MFENRDEFVASVKQIIKDRTRQPDKIINNYVKTITSRTSYGVIDTLSKHWDSFTPEQKIIISGAFAGKYYLSYTLELFEGLNEQNN